MLQSFVEDKNRRDALSAHIENSCLNWAVNRDFPPASWMRFLAYFHSDRGSSFYPSLSQIIQIKGLLFILVFPGLGVLLFAATDLLFKLSHGFFLVVFLEFVSIDSSTESA